MGRLKTFKISIALLLTMFIGISGVSAAQGGDCPTTTYRVGDEVSLYVNDNTVLKGKVIEDLTDSCSLKVYLDVTGAGATRPTNYADSLAALSNLKQQWTNVSDIKLLSESDINTLNLDLNLIDEGWLSDAGATGSHKAIKSGRIEEVLDTDELNFVQTRTVVISKGFLQTTSSSDDDQNDSDNGQTVTKSFMDQVAEKFNTTDYYKKIVKYFGNLEIKVDGKVLTVTATSKDNANLKMEVIFTYDNDVLNYELVTYKNQAGVVQEDSYLEQLLAINMIYAVSDVKGIDAEKLLDSMVAKKDLTLFKDGIHVSYEDITIKSLNYDEELYNLMTANSRFSTLIYCYDVKLSNLDKTVETIINTSKQENRVITENPKTGMFIGCGSLIIALLVVMGLYVKTKGFTKLPLSK